MTDTRTISDFGEQWRAFRGNEGYHGSKELFDDILHPLLSVNELRSACVVDIGSGTGRIVNMLLDCGVQAVTAIEPSVGFQSLIQNITDPARVTCLNILGHELRASGEFDYAFSLGVFHTIADPDPVMKAVFDSLKPGARFFIWLYGKENNKAYLLWATPLRRLTVHLPHPILMALVEALYWPLRFYGELARYLPLPMHAYYRALYLKVTPRKRREILYDQFNPHYSKYYTKSEAVALLDRNGFIDVKSYHRLGYSWSVVGTKP